jgi:hypothetical protein
MNRPFDPATRRSRTTLAAAAVLVTMLIAVSIEGLIDHYHGSGQGLASAQPVVVAQR